MKLTDLLKSKTKEYLQVDTYGLKQLLDNICTHIQTNIYTSPQSITDTFNFQMQEFLKEVAELKTTVKLHEQLWLLVLGNTEIKAQVFAELQNTTECNNLELLSLLNKLTK